MSPEKYPLESRGGTANGTEGNANVLEPLAIVGFSLKYPNDASTPTGFWNVLRDKRSVMTEWPADRFNLAGFFMAPHESLAERKLVHGAHFLNEDLGAFDASFFGTSAGEAAAQDVQHRKLLEVTYHALENAGITMEEISGTQTGVYSGSMADDYAHIVLKDLDDFPTYAASGLSKSMLANRLSWFYNLHGPSIAMDSACSSSLMAFNFACMGLQNKECDMAVVTGSSVVFAPDGTLSLIKMNFLSPEGRSYAFDDRASGYSRGEGFSVVLVKRLKDALKDGNIIRAVVRSSGSNQDGHTAGITQPSSRMQAELIEDTYRKAGLSHAPTRFFEAHGTGTPLGDPIEADAIGKVFRTARSADDPLYVGALKSNIGHLEGGSGLAGIIKAIMVLEKGLIPPNANFENINPAIDSEFLHLKFPTEAVPWPSPGLRRASVASFGFGGSNAHVILDDAYNFLRELGTVGRHSTAKRPPVIAKKSNDSAIPDLSARTSPRLDFSSGDTPTCPIVRTHTDSTKNHNSANGDSHSQVPPQQARILVLSAADEAGVRRLAESYERHWKEDLGQDNQPEYLDKFAYTLSCRRTKLAWRSFAIVNSSQTLANLANALSRPVLARAKEKVVFVFTGQGAQYRNMGAGLLAYEPFRTSVESFDIQLRHLQCPWSVATFLSQGDGSSLDVDDPEVSQTVTTALQIALFRLFQAMGIEADLVVGHSSGEIGAAYAAGLLDLGSACTAAYFRGKLASSLKTASSGNPGAMMAVDLPEQDMCSILSKSNTGGASDAAVIACVNSPHNVTISGSEAVIDGIQQVEALQGVRTRKLKTGVAYHSPQMNVVAAQYAERLVSLRKDDSSGTKPLMISTVTGDFVKDWQQVCSPDYWITNMLSTVQFSKAMAKVSSLLRKKQTRRLGTPHPMVDDVVELGPHSALQRPIADCLEHYSVTKGPACYYSSLKRNVPAIESVLNLAGKLYAAGYAVKVHKANEAGYFDVTHLQILTDLPPYPFNHSKTYWHESAISRQGRLRPFARHELLGVPVLDWNPLEPRWRKFFDLNETPWLAHHQVNGSIIYPAAGMMTMAVQGATQIADPNRRVASYELRDVNFTASLPLSPVGRSEAQLHMRFDNTHTNRDTASLDFRVYALGATGWYQNCSGNIRVTYEDQSFGLTVSSQEQSFYWKRYTDALNTCTLEVPRDKVYSSLVENGLQYGPAFQLLDKPAWDGANTAIGEINCFSWNAEYSHNAPQPYIMHPTVFDAVGHLVWVSLTKGCSETVVNGAAITHIRYAWMPGSPPNSSVLRAFSTASMKGMRKTDATIAAFDSAGNLALRISHVETTSVGESKNGAIVDDSKDLCFKMEREPDPDFLGRKQLLRLAGKTGDTGPSASFYQDLHLVLFYFVMKAVAVRKKSKEPSFDDRPHLRRYTDMLDHQVRRFFDGTLPHSSPDWIQRINDDIGMQAHIHQVEQASLEGQFYVHVGRSISDVITGDKNPLEVMFGSGLAGQYYEVKCKTSMWLRPLVKYLKLLSFKSPNLKVLEIGAGTGSFTTCVLEGLGTQFERYDYTDISTTFFGSALDKFASFQPRIHFSALDIENDVAAQGFQTCSYDLVVVGWVLHATHDLNKSINQIHKLLKPGGKLILLEITEPDNFRNGVAFGTLPGWWLGTEPERLLSPCVSTERWEDILNKNGFHGADIALPDHQDEACRETSILIATSTDPVKPVSSISLDSATEVALIVSEGSSLQSEVALHLGKQQMDYENRRYSVLPVSKLTSDITTRFETLVFLVEIGQPYLSRMDQTSFDLLQQVLGKAHKVIWVTHSALTSPIHADLQMVLGLARVLRTEKPGLCFATLSLESPGFDMAANITCIARVISVAMSSTSSDSDLEYTEQDGLLYINRVSVSKDANQQVYSEGYATTRHLALSESPPIVLGAPKSGLLDSLRWEEDATYLEALGPDEVELQVCAMGINFRDLLVVLGKNPQTTIGCECAGVVTRVGTNCSGFEIGDRVCACIIGCSRTIARCNFQLMAKIPDAMIMAEAASLPCTGVTAYYSLITLANLRSTDSILIHSAMGGTGQMTVQLAQAIGAEVFVTVGTEEKRQLIKELYNVPDDHILNSRNTMFARDIACLTNGRGVDVVVNSLAGDALLASWECVAPFGRFIELGKADIENNSSLTMSQFSRNVTFFAVAVDHLVEERPQVIAEALRSSMALLAEGTLRTASPLHVQPISEFEYALRHMQSGKNAGKMVMTFNPADQVPVLLGPRYSCRFDAHSTYLIAGGLGGLGRSAARWMSQQGAMNLILLGRSGIKSEQAQELVKELREAGVEVRAPPCDVSRPESLADALASCSDLPPIKGCLQATMVLKDALFETMTWSQWSESLQSKVQSTRNLHEQLPKNLSFFVMLSSAGGIAGTMGQSNYAAGNVFQDGLAAHRLAVGEKAVSIDLGRMAEVGVLAEGSILDSFKDTLEGLGAISEKEFLALLSRCCDPQYGACTLEESQPIVGLMKASLFLSRNMPVPDILTRPLFRNLTTLSESDKLRHGAGGSGKESIRDWATEMIQASSASEAVQVVTEALAQRVARSTSTPYEEIDYSQPLHAHGVDSLLAVELRNWLKKVFQAEIAIFDIIGQASLGKVAEDVAQSSMLLKAKE